MPRLMSWTVRALLVSGMGVLSAATAQTAHNSIFDPRQLPTVRGVIAQYTLLPHGAVDGFLLKDSTQVLAVPIFSYELLTKIHVGDAVTVYGLKASDRPLVMAMAIINDKSTQSVLLGEIPLMLAMGRAPSHDHGPAGNHDPAPSAQAAPSLPSVQLHGTVEQTIYGPLGTVSGALLRDGVMLRVASTESERVAPLLKAGNSVWVKGQLTESPLGDLLILEAIGSSADNLTPLAPWDGPQ